MALVLIVVFAVFYISTKSWVIAIKVSISNCFYTLHLKCNMNSTYLLLLHLLTMFKTIQYVSSLQNFSQIRRVVLSTALPRMCSRCWGRRGTVVMLWRQQCESHIWSCTEKSCETCWNSTLFIKSFISERTTRETQVITRSFLTDRQRGRVSVVFSSLTELQNTLQCNKHSSSTPDNE